jgi:hypothetical protein
MLKMRIVSILVCHWKKIFGDRLFRQQQVTRQISEHRNLTSMWSAK